MKQIYVTNQKEFDRIKLDFEGEIIIEKTTEEISISVHHSKAEIYVRGSATISYVGESATISYVGESATIRDVRGSATIGYVRGSATIGYVGESATISYVRGSATISYVGESATIGYVGGSATIGYVGESATIRDVRGSATIRDVRGSATIGYVGESATIGYVGESATIRDVGESATIRDVRGSATIKRMSGYASVLFAYHSASITCVGKNLIRYFKTETKLKIKVSKSTTVIKLDPFKPSLDSFLELYPADKKQSKLIFYKAVHKYSDGTYHSEYKKDFIYSIGEIKTQICNPSTEESCSDGLHISDKAWALAFSCNWEDRAILECEVDPKDIVVAKDTDGKVRTSKLEVIREVPESEWYE